METYDDKSFNCLRCGACCGPHYVSPAEEEVIDKYLSEHKIEKRAFKSIFDKCPYFQQHSCLIYPVRPLVCKLMGMTDLMPCPHNVKTDHRITAEEATELLQRLMM